jgi:hypothetical protein
MGLKVSPVATTPTRSLVNLLPVPPTRPRRVTSSARFPDPSPDRVRFAVPPNSGMERVRKGARLGGRGRERVRDRGWGVQVHETGEAPWGGEPRTMTGAMTGGGGGGRVSPAWGGRRRVRMRRREVW